MATTSQIVDEFVIQTRIDDQSAAGAETATKSVNQIEAAAKKAAASLGMTGSAGTTGQAKPSVPRPRRSNRLPAGSTTSRAHTTS
jgi:hypothetical protein